MWGAHAVHERRRGGGERVESTVLFLEGGGVVVVLPVVSSCSHKLAVLAVLAPAGGASP